MAEYWKSTPKYWCKHCSTYVKDTKFERSQHEATGRHQGNLKRSLRGIQNDHEKDEREKQKARAEVERLNRAVGGPSSARANTPSVKRPPPVSASQATLADRKRQMAQLAEMGIAVPDEYRGEMALAGDWQVVSQKPVDLQERVKEAPPLSIGIHKRKLEGQEEEEEAGETLKKRGWGSTTREYPTLDKPELDALFTSANAVKKEESDKLAPDDQVCYDNVSDSDASLTKDQVHVKQEDNSETLTLSGQMLNRTENPASDNLGAPDIVFKKRRSKNARHK